MVLILLTILIAVGGVKLLYAFLADRAGVLLSRSAGSSLNRAAAVLLAIIGLLVILKSLPGT